MYNYDLTRTADQVSYIVVALFMIDVNLKATKLSGIRSQEFITKDKSAHQSLPFIRVIDRHLMNLWLKCIMMAWMWCLKHTHCANTTSEMQEALIT